MKTLIKWSVEDGYQMIETGILSDRPVELLAGELVQNRNQNPILQLFDQEGRLTTIATLLLTTYFGLSRWRKLA